MLYNLHFTAVLTTAVAVTAGAMKGPGMIVGGTMAGDMEIMRIDTEEVIGMVLTITGTTGRECHYRSFSCDITFQNLKLKIHQSFYPHQA